MKKPGSYAKEALVDMAKAIKDVFKDYSLSARKQAWHKLIKDPIAKSEMEQSLINPKRSNSRLMSVSFKEWLEAKET
jgi:hypothetical protein